ncbi:hypothetical protein ABT008_26430 [Micromonospora sp. NPDC002389]|uniref:hypothetical protein n=1 Tax=Micromonospora sp. NPDC002389 TaxID=3154272 RepID=UPI003331CC74
MTRPTQAACSLSADELSSYIEAVGLREVCRLVRRAQGKERDDQAIMLARAL